MISDKPGTLKLIFGRIWACWAVIVFTLTLFIMLVPFFLFSYYAEEPKKTKRFILYSKIWMSVFLPLAGCPLRVKGKGNFKPGENYIVVCNHNSFMDVPVSTPFIPGANKTIAKSELAKVPLFGYLYKAGSILVDRSSETSRKESLLKMKKVLEMGMHMCIYPEGSRNKTEQALKPFHDGAFRLAIGTKKAILPTLIFNTRDTLPTKPSFYLMPHKLEMHFLEAIPVLPGETCDSLKQRTFKIMEAYYIATAPSLK